MTAIIITTFLLILTASLLFIEENRVSLVSFVISIKTQRLAVIYLITKTFNNSDSTSGFT